jgi:hypothetical protein
VHRPPPIDLSARAVVVATLSLYRLRFRRIAPVAIVVFGLLGVFRAFASTVFAVDQNDLWLTGLAVTASGFATFGSTFYAGFLDEEVGGSLRGDPPPTLSVILHDLPWTRLLVADLLLTIVVTVLQLGLVLPGLVVFTLFAVVGPIINIERSGVRDSFARSMRLVRPHFRLVLLIVTLPLFVEHSIFHALSGMALDRSFVTVWLANAAAGLTVGSVVGLIEVVLAHGLIQQWHERTSTTSPV